MKEKNRVLSLTALVLMLSFLIGALFGFFLTIFFDIKTKQNLHQALGKVELIQSMALMHVMDKGAMSISIAADDIKKEIEDAIKSKKVMDPLHDNGVSIYDIRKKIIIMLYKITYFIKQKMLLKHLKYLQDIIRKGSNHDAILTSPIKDKILKAMKSEELSPEKMQNDMDSIYKNIEAVHKKTIKALQDKNKECN